MKASSAKLLFALLVLASAAAAQDIPHFAPVAMRRFVIAPAEAAPVFTHPAFHAANMQLAPPVTGFGWEPERPAPRRAALPLLRTFQRNRLVALVAGGVPALERAFDDDAAPRRRLSVSPLIDLDDGRVGVRVKLRFAR
jgi:hypothetical protein